MDADFLDYNELLIKGFVEKPTKRAEAWATAFRKVKRWLKDFLSVPPPGSEPGEKIEDGDYISMDTH